MGHGNKGGKKIRKEKRGVRPINRGLPIAFRSRVGGGINSGLNRSVAIAGINNFVRLSCKITGT